MIAFFGQIFNKRASADQLQISPKGAGVPLEAETLT
jgi:hypothetical protein